MLFYLVLGSLFTVYALDLLLLVVVATIARAKEAVQLVKRYNKANPENTAVSCGCLPTSSGVQRARAASKLGAPSSTFSRNHLGRPGSVKFVGAVGAAAGDAAAAAAAAAPPAKKLPIAMKDSALELRRSSDRHKQHHGGAKHPASGEAAVHPQPDGGAAADDRPADGAAAPPNAGGGGGHSPKHHDHDLQPSSPSDDTLASPTPSTTGETDTQTSGEDGAPPAHRFKAAAVDGPHPDLNSNLSSESDMRLDSDVLAAAGGVATGGRKHAPAAAAAGAAASAAELGATGKAGHVAIALSEEDELEPAVVGLPVDPKAWPKVLVQLPMYNEEAHCDLIVQRCCKLRWPKERLLIQVLDDSTKQEVRSKVDAAVVALIEDGYPVQVLRRDNRQGYKAGAMVEGLTHLEGQGFEYAAIFDADFEPPVDFLEETVPHLHNDRALGFVQTRWQNPSNSFLTWAQRINLDFHFDVEQRARSYLGWFFNFNGTAGVWRIAAIHDAGGWESDTVVEDMDLSLRCYLNGWTALYLNHVNSPNELPCTLSSYKTQQFRWLSGPMQILIKCFMLIWCSNKISFWKRLNCYWFFLRYIIFAAITIGVLCVPPVVLWLDRWEWKVPQIFYMVAINFAMAVYLYITPWSLPYLLFSVAIGYFKTHAMLSGLIGAEKSKKWKVTKKYGSGGGGFSWRNIHKPYTLELLLGMYYAGMCAACFLVANWMLGGYCVLMALLFMAISFGDYFF